MFLAICKTTCNVHYISLQSICDIPMLVFMYTFDMTCRLTIKEAAVWRIFSCKDAPVKRNGMVLQLGHFYTQMEIIEVKSNSVYHIAKRIAQVKFLNYFNTRYWYKMSRSMHLQLKIILIKESLVDLYSWMVGFGNFWNCPV